MTTSGGASDRLARGQLWLIRWLLVAAGIVAMLLAVFLVVPRLLYPPVPASQLVGVAPDKRIELETNRLNLQNNARTALLQGLGGVVLLFGAYTAWRQLQENVASSRKERHLDREGQVTERFTRAIEQLDEKKTLDQRIGGIYALDRIMRDSPKDHRTVVEVLAAFIRVRADVTAVPPSKPAPLDVEAALTVLGHRPRRSDIEVTPIRLSSRKSPTNLHGTILRGAHLQHMVLRGAHLEGIHWEDSHLEGVPLRDAHLYKADLEGAHLEHAGLANTTLDKANLKNAYLDGADLEGASLEGAHLEHAGLANTTLDKANLKNAYLDGADLEGASLDGAHLAGVKGNPALTPAQQAQAHCHPEDLTCPDDDDAIAQPKTQAPDRDLE